VTENLIVDGMPQQRKFRQTVILSGLAADTDTPAQQKAQKISKLSLHVNLLIFAAASPDMACSPLSSNSAVQTLCHCCLCISNAAQQLI